MSQKLLGPIKQIAYIVDNIDTGIQQWITLAGVGPWTVFRSTTMNGECRGVPTTVKMNVGLSYQDGMQIELIEVLSKTPSPYQDASGRPLTGMHHIAWHSTDLDGDGASAQARGLKTAFAASNGAVRVAYMESPQAHGMLLEFIEATPVVLDGFAAGIKASQEWDGVSNPVQTYDFEARA
jgi:methylmalonyl-CoA/ethylmalonyl-CoA epimerase